MEWSTHGGRETVGRCATYWAARSGGPWRSASPASPVSACSSRPWPPCWSRLGFAVPALRRPSVGRSFLVGLSAAPLVHRLASTAVAAAWSAPPRHHDHRASTRGARGRSSRPACCWRVRLGSACSPRPDGAERAVTGPMVADGGLASPHVDSVTGDRLPRPRRDHADAASGHRGPDRPAGHGRQRVLAAHLRPAGPPGRRGVARAHGPGARRAAVRGRLHLRRHRVRQPRRHGHCSRPGAGRTRRRIRILVQRHRAPRRARLRRAPGRATRAPRSPGSSPTRCGRIDRRRLRAAIERTPTRSPWSRVMWANNEVGTVQPVAELAALAHEFGVPVPHRRGPGGRPPAGRLRRSRAPT